MKKRKTQNSTECISESFRQKLSSYRNQDTIKDRYSEENFTDIEKHYRIITRIGQYMLLL